eukprot:768554-Hanusia_phi.AAC.2
MLSSRWPGILGSQVCPPKQTRHPYHLSFEYHTTVLPDQLLLAVGTDFNRHMRQAVQRLLTW